MLYLYTQQKSSFCFNFWKTFSNFFSVVYFEYGYHVPGGPAQHMSHIKSVSKPEVLLRSCLFSLGLRFRKNDKKLPGSPDIVFPKFKAVVFVNGCFWHGHRHCSKFRIPSTHPAFWRNKFRRNRERDQKNISALLELGWRVGVVWECSITGSNQSSRLDNVASEIALWLEEGLATPYIEW